MHRLGLTYRREGVPKFIRENTEQFFAMAASKNSTLASTSTQPVSIELQQQLQQKENYNEDSQENLLATSTSEILTPAIVLPPIQTASSRRPQAAPSASMCLHQTTFHSPIPSSGVSLQSSARILPPKRQIQRRGLIDQDIFRKAYDRALSVARSRLLFRDPYSLTRASATHGVLYSYYDHTPMCIFSRGAACNHREDKTNIHDQSLESNIPRKKIFNDVVVEHYIR